MFQPMLRLSFYYSCNWEICFFFSQLFSNVNYVKLKSIHKIDHTYMLKLFIQASPQFFISSFKILSDKVMIATLYLLWWSSWCCQSGLTCRIIVPWQKCVSSLYQTAAFPFEGGKNDLSNLLRILAMQVPNDSHSVILSSNEK